MLLILELFFTIKFLSLTTKANMRIDILKNSKMDISINKEIKYILNILTSQILR